MAPAALIPPRSHLDPRRAQHTAAAGDVHGDDGVDADEDIVADRDVPDDLGSGADEDVVADLTGILLTFPGMRRADGDAVEEERATAESPRTADHQPVPWPTVVPGRSRAGVMSTPVKATGVAWIRGPRTGIPCLSNQWARRWRTTARQPVSKSSDPRRTRGKGLVLISSSRRVSSSEVPQICRSLGSLRGCRGDGAGRYSTSTVEAPRSAAVLLPEPGHGLEDRGRAPGRSARRLREDHLRRTSSHAGATGQGRGLRRPSLLQNRAARVQPVIGEVHPRRSSRRPGLGAAVHQPGEDREFLPAWTCARRSSSSSIRPHRRRRRAARRCRGRPDARPGERASRSTGRPGA